jgi:hypothetical protein
LHFKQGKISFGFPETIDKFLTDLPSFKGTKSRDIFVFFYSHGKIYGGQIRNAYDFVTFQENLLHISITVFLFWMDPSQPIKASIKGRLWRTSVGHSWALSPLYSPS